MTKTSDFERLGQALETSQEVLGQLSAHRKKIAERMAQLEKQGMVKASLSWAQDRYLYLLYPTQAGEKRRREYVGNNPARVKDAVKRVQRYKAYEQLKEQADNLDRILLQASFSARELAEGLRRNTAIIVHAPFPDVDDIIGGAVKKAFDIQGRGEER